MAVSENDTTVSEHTLKIRALNDRARAQIMMPIFDDGVPCKTVYTQGIGALGPESLVRIAALVRRYDDFTEDSDPHGEHDFGVIALAGVSIFWKFDYYDRGFEFGSEDPADPEKTGRVLTILLASEY